MCRVVAILLRVFKVGLTEKVIFQKVLKKVRELSRQISGGRTFH